MYILLDLIFDILCLEVRSKRNQKMWEDNKMTEKGFAVAFIGVIFGLAFCGGALAICAAFCLTVMVAIIWDEAKKEAKEEKKRSLSEKTV